MAKNLHMHGLYSNMGMYVTDDNYIVSAYPYTTTDYEYEQTLSFNQFLKENQIHLLYVNQPNKYTDDTFLTKQFGIETYNNQNADRYLARIREVGIPALDLRDYMASENLNWPDLFYRTDHHWTTPAGLWAAQRIAQAMNEYCGYQIDTDLYDISHYEVTNWENCWLGEQGRKIAKSYVGLDSFTRIKPNFSTDYSFKKSDGNYSGTFDGFIDEAVYNMETDEYQSRSWHYSYSRLNCINNNAAYGKVLVLGDSFANVMEPFFSLGVHEIDNVTLRDMDGSFDLYDYILQNQYDIVLICYVQSMIGAHDNPQSANYRMFTFQ